MSVLCSGRAVCRRAEGGAFPWEEVRKDQRLKNRQLLRTSLLLPQLRCGPPVITGLKVECCFWNKEKVNQPSLKGRKRQISPQNTGFYCMFQIRGMLPNCLVDLDVCPLVIPGVCVCVSTCVTLGWFRVSGAEMLWDCG